MRAIVVVGAVLSAVLGVPLRGVAAEQPSMQGGATEPLPIPVDALPVPERNALVSFVAEHPDCASFFDGCQICRKQESGSLACSTPGIACSKESWRCQEPGPPAALPLPSPPEQK